jgi:hypothetical protein
MIRRYQVHYGIRPQKGYIVTDAGDNPTGPNTKNVIFQSDNKGEAIKFADDKNAEVSK